MTTEKNKRKAKRRQEKKRERLQTADASGFKKFTDFHWRKSINGLAFDYWPSTRKAMYNGVVLTGVDNVDQLCEHLEKRGIK